MRSETNHEGASDLKFNATEATVSYVRSDVLCTCTVAET